MSNIIPHGGRSRQVKTRNRMRIKDMINNKKSLTFENERFCN